MPPIDLDWTIDIPPPPPAAPAVPASATQKPAVNAPFGTDFRLFPDLTLEVISDPAQVLGQEIWLRSTTPAGNGLFYDSEYLSEDVRELLNESFDEDLRSSWEARLTAAYEQDERVDSASVSLAFDQAARRATITIGVSTAIGPFAFVLAATQLTVDLLRASSS